MTRTQVNPWPWSLALGYSQALRIEGARRHLVCSGQTAVDAAGTPMHAGDMRGQLTLALDNLEAVLAAAGMGLAQVTRLTIHATDVDQVLRHMDVPGARLAGAGVVPAMTLVGVTRLALPPLMIEITADATD